MGKDKKKIDVSEPAPSGWRHWLYELVFEAETPAGRAFDLAVIVLILLSVIAVFLESVGWIRDLYGAELRALEWAFTILFTIELGLRMIAVRRPIRYVTSFYGLVDLIAVLPTYLSLFFFGTQYLVTLRILRMLRIFRILKLSEYVSGGRVITTALRSSKQKISVFLVAVIAIVTVVGSLMYAIEGEEHGFTSIPTSIYWAIVTMTTVGYGDLSPQTPAGKLLASIVMILGYGIIAVPTGIVTAELARHGTSLSTHVCPECHGEGHDIDATYCKYCSAKL